MRRTFVGVIGGLALAAMCATPAAAQSGVLQGMVGMTDTDKPAVFVSGALGGRINWIELTGEFGRMRDVTPTDVRHQVQASTINGIAGTSYTATTPAWYGLFNATLKPDTGVVKPFIGFGAGWARLEPRLQLTSGGGNVAFSTIFTGQKFDKPVAELSGGVEFDLGPNISIDAAYRYFRIYSNYHVDANFNNDPVLTNVHSFYAGLGIRF